MSNMPSVVGFRFAFVADRRLKSLPPGPFGRKLCCQRVQAYTSPKAFRKKRAPKNSPAYLVFKTHAKNTGSVLLLYGFCTVFVRKQHHVL